MTLEETAIYPLIREHPALCELHTFHRNQYITRVSWSIEDVWYLVSGRVKVEATTQNGKKLLVDLVSEDNFVGHLSNYYGQNFYSDSITMTNSALLRIPADMFRALMERQDFSRLFFVKTNARLYNMYKKELMRGLFSQRQQFAFYLIEKTCDDVCKIDSIYFIGEYLKISRRNLYNLLARFEQDGILARLESGDIRVLDMRALRAFAQPVADFQYNKI